MITPFLHYCTLPTGKALRNTFRTMGPAMSSWNGKAMIKFLGILVSQIIPSCPHSPVLTHTSSPPYKLMTMTIGTTIHVEMQMILRSVLLSGFTRKRKQNAFANLETKTSQSTWRICKQWENQASLPATHQKMARPYGA